MAEHEPTAIAELAKVNIPTNTEAWIKHIKEERVRSLQQLAVQSRKLQRVPDLDVEPAKSQYERFRVFLKKMDDYLQMTPYIRQKSAVDQALLLVLNEEQFHFPETDVDAAKALMERWESENWGANEVVEDEAEEEDGGEDESEASAEPPPKRRRKSSAMRNPDDSDAAVSGEALLPPIEHPIFGIKGGKRGIMYGAARKRGQRTTWVLNPALISQKCSGKAYGSNGIPVGAWFPKQIVALFNGAHGNLQGGIAGNTDTGAYSIVVSKSYEGLDEDMGNELYYSGSNSHKNTDPQRPAPSTQGTQALQASLASQKPVRVLRAASKEKAYAPIVGLRYDGLYRVVSEHRPKNRSGGLYEQYRLVRIAGQPEIDLKIPGPRERADYDRIGMGYA